MKEPILTAPSVRFPADYLARLELLEARCKARRERGDELGSSALAGYGLEFFGYRPYRPGESLRFLDWNLLARLDRPYVREMRREASAAWVILVDTSASMGLGGIGGSAAEPEQAVSEGRVGSLGKLQRAAEVACALAWIGMLRGSQVRLLAASGLDFLLRDRTQLRALVTACEGLRAEGRRGMAGWGGDRRLRGATQCIAVGDLMDVQPAELLAWVRRGRRLAACRILAPEEISPPARPMHWIDPESGVLVVQRGDAASLRRYARELDELDRRWEASFARHGARWHKSSSSAPFEDIAARLLA
jgi:uncharacterized protein (DUF58 family)